MAPTYPGQIRIDGICLGMSITMGNIVVPDKEIVRKKVFAFAGLEFSDTRGTVSTYSMVLDENGKFNYSPEGILYKKTD